MSRVIKNPDPIISAYNWDGSGAPQPLQAKISSPGSSAKSSAEESYQSGYKDGENVARAAHEKAMAACTNEVAKSVAQLAVLRANIFREAQADLLRLSTAIARRILHRELMISPDILQGIVSVVLEKVEGQEIYRIRVHPSMVQTVEQYLSQQVHHSNIKVTADATLGLGGCIFQTARGSVDASVDSQLAEIEIGLADLLEKRS